MSQEIPDQVMDAILRQLLSGNKIAAVKLYKDQTQTSLVEAKSAIDALSVTIAQQSVQMPADQVPDQVLDQGARDGELERLIYSRQKIAAVKLYRQRHNVSLFDAKHAVEKLTEQLQAQYPERFIARSSTGCAAVLLAIAAIPTAIVCFF